MYLPDINVWLALTFEVHSHHRTARLWFEKDSARGCAFCRFTQAGFLRLATNPAVFRDETLTLSEAWKCYDALIHDPRIEFSQESLGMEHLWRTFTMKGNYSHKVWNDAYLAAVALAGSFRLVTFDQGFSRYEGLEPVLLPD